MGAMTTVAVARWGPLAVALTYLAVGWLYIVVSTLVVYWLTYPDGWDRGEQIELVKGLAFVGLTAVLIWALVRALTQRLTAQTARAEALAEANRTLFETMPEPAYVYDGETLRFLLVNDAAVRRYGWPREQFLQLTLYDIRPRECWPELEQALRRKQLHRSDPATYVHQDAQGHRFRVRVNTAPFRYNGRDAWLVVATRVEELVAAQEALERMNQELEVRVAERTRHLQAAMAELSWFTEAVSHDLRRPVEHLVTLGRWLAGSTAGRLSDEESESLRRMVGSSARLLHLIDDLLADRQTTSGVAERLSLVVLVNGVLGELRREFGRGVERVQVVEPLHWVQAHRPTLARVLTGLLRMALSRCDSEATVHVSASANGEAVRLSLTAPAGWLTDEEQRRLAGLGIDTESDGPQLASGSGEFEILLRSVQRLAADVEVQLADDVRPGVCKVTLVLGSVLTAVEPRRPGGGLLPSPAGGELRRELERADPDAPAADAASSGPSGG